MKAVLCRQYAPIEALTVEDVPSPTAGPGQVVVSIKAAGVNFPDALVVQGKHQFKPALPFTPGGELAGIVKEIGPEVTGFAVGQRVYGSRLRGSFAEEMAVDADKLLTIPEGMSFEEAAALSTTYNTSYYALVSLAQLRAGESVLVLGAAGGVGLAAIEIAKALGARVIAAASTDDKLAVCKAQGADELINYKTQELRERLKALTGTQGVDVVYDPVGGPYAEPALRGLGWRGRYLVVGFADGEIPRIPLNLVLLKNCSVIGVFLGETWTREPWMAKEIDAGMTQLIKDGKIHPLISGRYQLTQVADALNALLQRKVTGKVVIVP